MKVLIAGDYCPIERLDNRITNKEYDFIFNEVRPYTLQADYSIVNLECPVCMKEYTPIAKFGPNLQVKTKNAVDALTFAGFDMVTLANNHILDYGKEGLDDTLMTCKEYGLDVVGVGNNISEANKVFYKQIDGKILAVINCCEHEFSIATDTSSGTNPLNPIRQFYQIKEARNNADYVLVIVHGGHEHFQLPSPRMKEVYHFFIDTGADAVVNHHQHCFSGREIYNGKPIYYGLGNFCFDYKKGKCDDGWHKGFMLELDFSCKQIISREIPYIQCRNQPSVEILKDTEEFFIKFNRLNEIIVDDYLLNVEVNKRYDRASHYFSIYLEPYSNRYLRKLRQLKLIPSLVRKQKLTTYLNLIDCESHRDKLLYYLHKRNRE